MLLDYPTRSHYFCPVPGESSSSTFNSLEKRGMITGVSRQFRLLTTSQLIWIALLVIMVLTALLLSSERFLFSQNISLHPLLLQTMLIGVSVGISAMLYAATVRWQTAEASLRSLEAGFARHLRIDEDLRTTRDQLNHIVDNLDEVGFWSFDPRSQQLLYNSSGMEKIYGLDQHAFFENLDLWKQVVHPDDLSIVNAHEKIPLAGKPVRVEYRSARPVSSSTSVRSIHQRTGPPPGRDSTVKTW